MIDMQNKAIGDNKKDETDGMPFLILDDLSSETPEAGYRAGSICPKCRQAVLDYDGLLNLVCPNCGLLQGGCFT